MKNIYILITLFSGFCLSAQTISGIYNIRYLNKDGTSKDPIAMSYLYHSKTSLQRQIAGGGTILKDTLITDKYGKIHEVNGMINMPSDGFYYKDYSRDLLRIQFALRNEIRAIKDSIPLYEWILQEQEKIVLGYLCKKAITTTVRGGVEQKITAWYTEDIPFTDGPQEFNGLPGFILALEGYKLFKIEFEKLNFFEENVAVSEPESSVAPLTIAQYNIIYGRKN